MEMDNEKEQHSEHLSASLNLTKHVEQFIVHSSNLENRKQKRKQSKVIERECT